MVKSGLISFGGHTHNHAILSRLSPSEQQQEIRESIEGVEVSTGKALRVLCLSEWLERRL